MKRPIVNSIAIVALAASLAACSEPSPTNATSTTIVEANGTEIVPVSEGDVSPEVDDAAANMAGVPDYAGRWTGVEGMYLVVTPKPAGGVALEMQWSLDDKGSFDGSITAEGIRFMRNGVAEVLAPTDGDATGLKYLAGKTDCLTVKSGEGYCRD